ncbi:phage late control D family protein [Aequorivita sp. H23M31]|uniref:Phage late control D family protein n=1 Tax=Aequorivita ciconiae TaxID=2494375 RepID=A0A410G3I6_9FLAO|nr:phage late control D family protein [Aequorivita sp. H23M31]QAA81837.1 phage late control D family protein [Aequorivita sp. H23M31]
MGLDILICVNDIPNQNLTQNVNSVEVYEKIDSNTSYKLNFAVDICDGDIAQSIETDTAPDTILSVMANVNDALVCLVKGPITMQQTQLKHGGAGSSLHIEGEDTGQMLDHGPVFQVTDSSTDSDIASNIISNHSMTPNVEPTPESTHDENNHSHVQRESDLNLLRSLARRNGFHFWITYSNNGEATGHFKPRSLDSESANTLIINNENNNIEQLQISSDSTRPSRTEGRQINVRTLSIIGNGTTLNDTSLGSHSLSEANGSSQQTIHLAPVVDDAGALSARSLGALRDAQWFIKATGQTSLHQLCDIVRVHTIVKVDGAGSRHSGKYYVTGVKHKIDSTAYIMEFELERNAWGN